MKKILAFLVIVCLFSNQASFAYSGGDQSSSLVKKLVTSQLKAKYNSLSSGDKEKLVNELDDNLNKIYEKLDSLSESDFSAMTDVAVKSLQSSNDNESAKALVEKLDASDKESMIANISDTEEFYLAKDANEALTYSIASELSTQKISMINKLKTESLNSLKQKVLDHKAKLKHGGYDGMIIVLVVLVIGVLSVLAGVITLSVGLYTGIMATIITGSSILGGTLIIGIPLFAVYW